MGTMKKYLKSKPVCKVTFSMPKKAFESSKKVHIVGDFNDWQTDATPMKKLKNGDYKAIIDLPSGNEYQYRYLADGQQWINDWDADNYVPSPFAGEDNSVIVI